MTSQIYHADDDQLAQEHDEAMSEEHLIEPEASLAEPDAELAVAETDLADLTEPNADQSEHDDLASHPAGASTLADSEPATSMASGDPGVIPEGDDRVEEPETADSSPGSPSLVSEAFTVPESVPDSYPAGDTTSAAGPWNEVQALFVDDPRASIERAAALVDDRVEQLIQSLRERQRSMQSTWQADDAGTEELRVALQHYRSFWNSLEDLPAQD